MTTIEFILSRCGVGDYTLLNANEGVYMDMTGMPATVFEAAQLKDNLNAFYDSLDDETKQHFGDYNSFMESLGSQEFTDYFNSKIPKEEVTNNVENVTE